MGRKSPVAIGRDVRPHIGSEHRGKRVGEVAYCSGARRGRS